MTVVTNFPGRVPAPVVRPAAGSTGAVATVRPPGPPPVLAPPPGIAALPPLFPAPPAVVPPSPRTNLAPPAGAAAVPTLSRPPSPVRPLPTSGVVPPPPGIAAPPTFGAPVLPTAAPTNPASLRAAPPAQQEKAFAWDALMKEYSAKTGELSATLTFSLTNITDAEVTINSVRTSCGCTVAKLPVVPWRIAAGSSGTFDVVADLRGKSGILSKTVTIDSTAGYRFLTVRVSIPAGPATMADRARNMQVAMADRQAVFRGDCATCHAESAKGKLGEALYNDVCGVCHEAEHRASMVPNLHTLGHPADADFWKNTITKGKLNTLMPAFAEAEGGPLSPEQIQSLVEYLTGPFQQTPRTAQRTGNPIE